MTLLCKRKAIVKNERTVTIQRSRRRRRRKKKNIENNNFFLLLETLTAQLQKF